MIEKFSLQDKEIIQSLRKLNNTEPRYPEDLLENRRSVFISDLTALTLATPSSGFLKSKFRILSHISSKTLDFFLISLILIASIFDVYLFRNEITEWVKSKISTPIVSNSVLTLQPNLISTPIRTQTNNLTPTITVTVIYLKESEDKLYITQNTSTFIQNTPTTIQYTPAVIQKTPTAIQYTRTNPGNHYGQTKTPPP